MSDRYLMGSCHHLAVAMHRLTGWDLAVVVGPHGGRDAVLHAFCLAPDGTARDVRGAHALDDLVDEQTAATGRDAWCVRLDSEAAVWRLAAAGLLNTMHQSFVVDALEAAEGALGDDPPIVSDGWSPRDREAVERARSGAGPLPALGREAAMEPAAPPAP